MVILIGLDFPFVICLYFLRSSRKWSMLAPDWWDFDMILNCDGVFLVSCRLFSLVSWVCCRVVQMHCIVALVDLV